VRGSGCEAPHFLFIKNTKEEKAVNKILNYTEHQDALLRLAEISEKLTFKLDEEAMDLFEQYGNLHESVIKYSMLNKKIC